MTYYEIRKAISKANDAARGAETALLKLNETRFPGPRTSKPQPELVRAYLNAAINAGATALLAAMEADAAASQIDPVADKDGTFAPAPLLSNLHAASERAHLAAQTTFDTGKQLSIESFCAHPIDPV